MYFENNGVDLFLCCYVGELLWLSYFGDRWLNPLSVNNEATLIFFSWLDSPSGPSPPQSRGFVITLN